MNLFGGEDPFGGAGPAGLFAQFAQQMGAGIGPHRRRPPQQYNEYLKAFSAAMRDGEKRPNLLYGGKIIMPPSALANISSLELESPWMFKLSNPSNPAATTHAGVLEFIAPEGVCYLPYWMMKSLHLNEGDPIRISGTELPKGKFVKLQAQSVTFLEISDPKAVLEHALRNFSSLTQGDIIQISYNTIVFDLLIMDIKPVASAISIIDTDLEVDFAPPVGYVEPERPKAAPQPTMASKLNIDLNSSTPGSSRPSSSLGGAFTGATAGPAGLSKGGEKWESFKGKGETLSGRKTKGKGISQRKIENQMEGSAVYRTDKRRVVTNDSLEEEASAPAPLNLPPGKLFFGFKVKPYTKPAESSSSAVNGAAAPSFGGGGSGQSLIGSRPAPALSSDKGKEKAKDESSKPDEEKKWGKGQTLASAARRANTNGPVGAGGASVPRQPPSRNGKGKQKEKQKERERSVTPDWGVDDDDVIMIDSD